MSLSQKYFENMFLHQVQTQPEQVRQMIAGWRTDAAKLESIPGACPEVPRNWRQFADRLEDLLHAVHDRTPSVACLDPAIAGHA